MTERQVARETVPFLVKAATRERRERSVQVAQLARSLQKAHVRASSQQRQILALTRHVVRLKKQVEQLWGAVHVLDERTGRMP